MKGHRDLVWASVGALLCALLAALVPLGVVRVVAALPLTLFLPGYAIVVAAFADDDLAQPERLTLSLGVSLMVLVLGTLLLNVFPFGLTKGSWAVLLALVVVAACRWAALKRGRPRTARPLSASLARPSARTAAMVGAAILIGIGSIALTQTPLPAKNAEGFTVLWMLPTDSREEAVAVGVESNEQVPASYRLEVKMGKSPPRDYRMRLDPGEGRTFEIAVPAKPGSTTHVVASLYRDGKAQIYRRATRWLPRQKTFP